MEVSCKGKSRWIALWAVDLYCYRNPARNTCHRITILCLRLILYERNRLTICLLRVGLLSNNFWSLINYIMAHLIFYASQRNQ